MLRFLAIKNIPFNNSILLGRQKRIYYQSKSIFIQTNLPKCTIDNSKNIRQLDYCKIEKRFQSTRHNIEALTKKRKKRKLKNAKYVELLQVTQASTKQTKTKVKNLKAETLSNFIQKVDINNRKLNENKSNSEEIDKPFEYQMINLEMLDNNEITNQFCNEKPLIFFGKESIKPGNINEILESLESFKEAFGMVENHLLSDPFGQEKHIIEQDENDRIHSEEFEVVEEELDRETNKAITATGTKKTHSSKSKQKNKSIYKTENCERLAREKSLLMNLSSYLKICVSSGMTNRGLTTLMMYRYKYMKQPFLTIEIYNILLHGYAEKGNYNKIKEILNILNEDGIKLNHQSFAAIFECLGRLEIDDNNLNELKNLVKKAEKLDITLNDIMDKSKFHSDQREIVLDAINRIEPDFVPIYTPPIITYDNVLLNKLNDDIKAISNTDDNINEDISTSSNKTGRFSADHLRQLAKEQLKVELEGSITIKSIETAKEFNDTEFYRKKLDEVFNLWRSQICAGISRDLNSLRARLRHKPRGLMTYYVYLKSLDAKQYADILLKEIRTLAEGSETYSPTVNQLYRELGNKVKAKYIVEQKKKDGTLIKVGDIYSDYCHSLENSNTYDNSRQIWQRIVHSKKSNGPSVDIDEIAWPNIVSIGVGKFLYNILMRDLKIDVNIMNNKKNNEINLLPAFYTLFRSHGKVIKEELKPHPILARLLRASHQQTLTFDSNLVPMLCPPQPWSTPVNGGYLLTKSELIRLPHQAVQQWDQITKSNPQSLYPALDSLNQLSSIPWRVNTDVLDVILEVFNDGGDQKLGIPQHPNTLPSQPTEQVNDPNLSKAKQAQIFQQKMIQKRKQAEMYSMWCDTLYRLSLANYYRNKVFWLPHNMDFRGRVYPIPPHLNHLGSDMARSMLVFDEARPLGPDGFTWLKLHCINLTGLKKRDSVRERILFAEEVMDDIIDSADNPLTGRKWWTKSDEPWQTLACCKEIANVMRSPNPEEYMSHFPIHQDGSCNGLQHYAALGRDKAGAHSVNLTPASIPQDVYSTVANLVEKMRQEDEKNGSQIAKILNGFVRRKVIKQTVMTTVYGVTRYGARLQIAKQLKDIDKFPQEWVWRASSYLTIKTFESLREMFTSTKEIQDWFTECARVISNTCNRNVEWITPLGLPIVQPYNNRIQSSKINNNLNKINERLSLDMYEKPNTMKQKNAFPPNFIHSLDSSHMMLTSLFCERKGITFVSVHDCFWTHACTVPDMNKICREQFVALHSQPILENLSEFMVKKYSFSDREIENDDWQLQMPKKKLNKILTNVPEKGDFDLNNVLESVYFFS